MADYANYVPENIDDNDKLEEGDHVAVNTDLWTELLQHHGIIVIFDGHSKVASFTPRAGVVGPGVVSVSSLGSFTAGRPLIRLNYATGKTGGQVASTAKSYAERAEHFGGYDFLNNNCEHFATFCKIDQPISRQAQGYEVLRRFIVLLSG